MGIVRVSRWHTEGIAKFEACRQNGLTSAHGMTMIADYVNTLTSQRMHVLAQGGSSIGAYPNSGLIVGGYFHTSPNCKRVQAILVCGRSASNTVLGKASWAINGTTCDNVYVAGSVSGTTGPQDFTVAHSRMATGGIFGADLTADTTYQWTLTTGAVALSVAYFLIFEVPADQVDPTADLAISHDVFQVGAPILDRDIGKVGDSLWTLYKRSGNPQFSWSHLVGTAPTANATFKNVLDATTTGYSSSASGFWTIPYRKNRFGSTMLDVLLWCVSSMSAGADGQVKFTNGAGTIGTITGITGSNVFTTTATIDASTSGSQLVVVEHQSAANTITTIAAGMYELI